MANTQRTQRGIESDAYRAASGTLPLDHWIVTDRYEKVLVSDADYRILASAPNFLSDQAARLKLWQQKQAAKSRGEAALAASQRASEVGRKQQEAQGAAMQTASDYSATYTQAFNETKQKALADAAQWTVMEEKDGLLHASMVRMGKMTNTEWLAVGGIVAVGSYFAFFRKKKK